MITDSIILLLAFLLIFFCTRLCIRVYLDASLPKRKRHRLERSDRTFIEWLLYKQYRDILPTPLLIYYFSIFVTFLISAVLIVIFHINDMSELERYVISIYFYGNSIIDILIYSIIRLSKKL
jgi:hypothetical protein